MSSFDLIGYAEEVDSKRSTPNYDELKSTNEEDFSNFVAGLRAESLPEEANKKTRVIVLGTGGTFQSAETDSGLAPTGTLAESFQALGLPEDPTVSIKLADLMNLDSSQMNVDHWRFLAEMIIKLENEASDKYDAIIVTHGTDTMANGASYLSFMLKGFPKSIIFTGSQVPARKADTDAKDQLDRALTTAKIACRQERRITEVLVACGLKISRGTWAHKMGDHTTDAFGPWNQPNTQFDAKDWEEAMRNGTLDKLSPAHLDFGTGKNRGDLEFASHAIEYAKKGAFEPFTGVTMPANIIPASLTDKTAVDFAQHIIDQRVSVLTQLGSATADDALVDIAMKAAEEGKLILLQAPFPDSAVEAGTYSAGAAVRKQIGSLQRSLPIINTSPAAFSAKVNFLLHQQGLAGVAPPEEGNLGVIYKADQARKFYDAMEQNMLGELV